jgi:hypothetical protein
MFGAGFTSDPPDAPMGAGKKVSVSTVSNPPTGKYWLAWNHLMLLGEFYACYLLSWSPTLWPGISASDLPIADLSDPQKAGWNTENVTRLVAFSQALTATRRVLANVPTLMILDDHDVTDDWFMNRDWCDRVLSDPGDTLGRRVIRNALIAYAIFQAWGNTPDQFAVAPSPAQQPPGAVLLANIATGAEVDAKPGGDLSDTPTSPTAADLVGMPPYPLVGAARRHTTALIKPPRALTFYYRWAPAGWPYEIIVLDCRTTRGYLKDPLAAPLLLDDGDFGARVDQTAVQIPPPDVDRGTAFLTVVVAQTPLLGIVPIDNLASFRADAPHVYGNDQEAWSMSPRAYQALVTRLVEHNQLTVVLSGDVHYAFGTTCDYQAIRPWRAPAPLSEPRTGRIVQLTSSAARNEIDRTRRLQSASELASWLNGDVVGCWNDPRLYSRFADVLKAADKLQIIGTKPNYEPPIMFPKAIYGDDEPEWQYRLLAAGAAKPAPATQLPNLPRTPDECAVAAGPVTESLDATAKSIPIVGVNNACVVTFSGAGPADWTVTQAIYARPDTPSSTQASARNVITAPLQYLSVW